MSRFTLAPYEEAFGTVGGTVGETVDETVSPSVPPIMPENQTITDIDTESPLGLGEPPSSRFSLMSPEESEKIQLPKINTDKLGTHVKNLGISAIKGFKDLSGQVLDDFSVLNKTDKRGLGAYSGFKGTMFKHRTKLSFTDSPEERNLALDGIFGKEGWKKTIMGVTINPDGLVNGGYIDQSQKEMWDKKEKPYILLDKVGLEMGDVADMAGHAPELITAVAVGMTTNGLGFIPALASVAASTGLVKLGQEELEALSEHADGFLPKNIDSTISEEGLDADTVRMGETAAKYAGVGEGVGRVVISTGQKLFTGLNLRTESAVQASGGWPTLTMEKLKDDPMGTLLELKRVAKALLIGKRGATKSTIDPAKLQTTAEANKMGIVLPMNQAVGETSNSLLQRAGAMADTVHKDVLATRQAKNTEIITKKMDELVEESGKDVEGKIIAQTGDDADELMRENIQKQVLAKEKEIEKVELKAQKTVEEKVSLKLDDKSLDTHGGKIQEGIRDQANKINASNRSNYGAVDKLLPKDPTTGTFKRQVPTKQIRVALKQYLDDTFQVKTTKYTNPRGQTFTNIEYVGLPKEAKQLLDDTMKADKMQSFQAIHASRSRFRNLAYDPEFLKTVDDRFFRIIEKAHDDALASARIGNNPKAYIALQFADAEYKKTIPLLDNKFIRNLVKDARKGGIQPSQVVGKIENASVEDVRVLFGRTSKSKEGLLSEAERESVRGGIIKTWFDKAGVSDGVKEINAGLLKRQLEKLEKNETFGLIFGNKSKGIRSLLQDLEATNAKINVKDLKIAKLNPTKFKKMLEDAQAMTKEKDAFIKQNYIKQMTNDEFKSSVDYLFRNGKHKELERVKTHFGKDSKEWITFKKETMEKMLGDTIDHTENIGHIVYKGEVLMNKLVGSSSMKKEIEVIFGKQKYKELLTFSKVLTASGRESAMSSGIVGAFLALHPYKNLTRIVGLRMMGEFLNSPAGIRWLTEGVKHGKFKKMTAQLGSRITGQVLAPQAGEAVDLTKRAVKGTYNVGKSLAKKAISGASKLVENRVQ